MLGLTVIVTAAGSTNVLSAVSRPFTKAFISGYKAKNSQNTGNIYLLDAKGNVSIPIAKGATVVLSIEGGAGCLNLADFGLDADTSGDGAMIGLL